MIYLMQKKPGGQFNPPIDLTRYYYSGPQAELEDWEKQSIAECPFVQLPAMPSMLRCERIPEGFLWRVPKEVYHNGPKFWPQLPDLIGIIVSERFRDLVEKFDPGVHQFIPVDIIHRKSRQKYTSQGQFFFFNALTKVCPQDLFDYSFMEANGRLKIHTFAHTPFKKIFVESARYSTATGGFTYDHYRTKRRAFGDHHIVFCLPCGTTVEKEDVHGTALWPLVTQEFKSAVQSLGIEGINFNPIPTVDE